MRVLPRPADFRHIVLEQPWASLAWQRPTMAFARELKTGRFDQCAYGLRGPAGRLHVKAPAAAAHPPAGLSGPG